MTKVLMDMLQITIVVRMGYSLIKWVLGSTKKHKKSIVRKFTKLISNKVHYKLDNVLKKQKELQSPSFSGGKVIPLKRTK